MGRPPRCYVVFKFSAPVKYEKHIRKLRNAIDASIGAGVFSRFVPVPPQKCEGIVRWIDEVAQPYVARLDGLIESDPYWYPAVVLNGRFSFALQEAVTCVELRQDMPGRALEAIEKMLWGVPGGLLSPELGEVYRERRGRRKWACFELKGIAPYRVPDCFSSFLGVFHPSILIEVRGVEPVSQYFAYYAFCAGYPIKSFGTDSRFVSFASAWASRITDLSNKWNGKPAEELARQAAEAAADALNFKSCLEHPDHAAAALKRAGWDVSPSELVSVLPDKISPFSFPDEALVELARVHFGAHYREVAAEVLSAKAKRFRPTVAPRMSAGAFERPSPA